MEPVNGKIYPMWGQFVDRKEEWIGGILQDFGDRDMPGDSKTVITDIELVPNGEVSAFFRVEGADFGCGFDVGVGGIIGGEEGWLTFSGYGGHRWRIRKPKEGEEDGR